MILGVGKYQDYDTYLPECKDMAERLSRMIHEILETTHLNGNTEQPTTVDLSILSNRIIRSAAAEILSMGATIALENKKEQTTESTRLQASENGSAFCIACMTIFSSPIGWY